MKLLFVISLFILCTSSLFSQEFIKHSTIHFKDATTVSGDFYYYPALEQQVSVVDSLGKKQVYDLASVDYIEGKSDLYKVIDFNGAPKLFETIVKGEKASLYKTNIRNSNQFYIFKDEEITWLEGGIIEFEMDGKKYRRESDRYKGILKFLFSDNTYVTDKIDKLKYFESNFKPLFIAYNNEHISYVKTKTMEKQNRVPNWKIYAQYSNLHSVSLMISEYLAPRFFQAGVQYFVSEGSKHSFKFGLAYAANNFNTQTDTRWFNLNTSYYYDLIRMPNENIYFGLRLLDMGMIQGETNNKFFLLPRLSSLLGYEHHITRKVSVYAEINQLSFITSIPRSFTFGLSYDL